MLVYLSIIITLLLYCLVSAYIENSVLGVPKVTCEERDLSLDIVTEKPFHGNIFVKGRARDSSCKQSYDYNSSSSYTLTLGKCGMQRLRSINPRGINFIITVIVSFHPAGFITRNDRAFNVKCFYMEPDTIVTSSLHVSPLATTELRDKLKLPTCDYSVRRDSINGPQLTFANVGETVFHVWECNGAGMGMLVKKCFVTDGEGADHAVLDFDGCSLDNFLLGELVYDSSLMRAYAQSQVFKYADSNQLFFTCQIRLCQKAIGNCDEVTPPKCPREENETDVKRNRRSVSAKDEQLNLLEMDVSTPEMLIGGVDDMLIGTTTSCFSPFLVALSNFVLFAMVTVLLVTVVIMKRETRKSIICITFLSLYFVHKLISND